MRLVELLQQAGVSDGVVNVVNGEGKKAGAALARHPLIAAQIFALATLELGGKAAVIFFDDMDLDRTVNGRRVRSVSRRTQCQRQVATYRHIYKAVATSRSCSRLILPDVLRGYESTVASLVARAVKPRVPLFWLHWTPFPSINGR